MNLNGTIEWYRTFGIDTYNEYPTSLSIYNNSILLGSSLISGFSLNPGQDITEFNFNGDIINTVAFFKPNVDLIFKGMTHLKNASYIIQYSLYKESENEFFPVYNKLKYKSGGILEHIWARRLQHKSISKGSIIELSNEDLIFGGTIDNDLGQK